MRTLHWTLLASIALVFSLLFVAMNTQFIVAGGSDSLEVVVKPSALSQWVTLTLFFCSYFFFILRKTRLSPLQKNINIILVLFFFALLMLNSHFFRISGRENKLVDSWFFIPTQSISFHPSGDASQIKYSIQRTAIHIHTVDNTSMTVITFPDFLGVSKHELQAKLNSFGFSME